MKKTLLIRKSEAEEEKGHRILKLQGVAIVAIVAG